MGYALIASQVPEPAVALINRKVLDRTINATARESWITHHASNLRNVESLLTTRPRLIAEHSSKGINRSRREPITATRNIRFYEHIQSHFRTTRSPTLLLWDERDQYLSVDAARAYKRDLPEAELAVFDGGHWLLESHSDEVNEAVTGFLARKI